jgi:hypothetical protein
MLGRNDHNLNGFNRDQFAEKLRQLVARGKTVVPNTRVLLVSTAQVKTPWSNMTPAHYLSVFPDPGRFMSQR